MLRGPESVFLLSLALLILLGLLSGLGWVHGVDYLLVLAFLFNGVKVCDKVQNLPRCNVESCELT